MFDLERLALAFSFFLATLTMDSANARSDAFVIRGRCHMGGCGFTQVLSTKELQTSDSGALIEVEQRDEYVEAPIVDDEPQWGMIKIPQFSGPPTTSWVFCSTEKPAVIFPNAESGGFYVDVISPGFPEGIYGANTSSHLFYWGICHNKLVDEQALGDGGFNAEAQALGYRRLGEDKEGQFQFRSLKQVYQFLKIR